MLLKTYLGTDRSRDSVEIEDKDEKEYEVEDIIEHRIRQGGRTEYLVSWIRYDASHNQHLGEEALINAKLLLRGYQRHHGLRITAM